MGHRPDLDRCDLDTDELLTSRGDLYCTRWNRRSTGCLFGGSIGVYRFQRHAAWGGSRPVGTKARSHRIDVVEDRPLTLGERRLATITTAGPEGEDGDSDDQQYQEESVHANLK
jgi:hypothetical protein